MDQPKPQGQEPRQELRPVLPSPQPIDDYDLDTDVVTKVTTLVGEFVGQVSVSGDGRAYVFERAAEQDGFGGALVDPDLWIVDSGGSDMRLLVEDAYAPAWSH